MQRSFEMSDLQAMQIAAMPIDTVMREPDAVRRDAVGPIRAIRAIRAIRVIRG